MRLPSRRELPPQTRLGRFFLGAYRVAYLSELLDPISILLALTNKNPMKQSLSYLFWGQGETALMAYTILVRYWEWTKREAVRPCIFLMSG